MFDLKPTLWQILSGILALCILVWLGWYFFWPKPALAPQKFKKAAPAHQVGNTAKVPGPVIAAPIKIIPKAVVSKKLADLPIKDAEVVIDTAEIPKAPYGATTVTTIDPVGLATTYVKANARPFFEFKKELEIGGGADLNVRGEKIAVLDVRFVPLRIGGMYLGLKGEGNYNPDAPRDKFDGKVGIRLFGRFE